MMFWCIGSILILFFLIAPIPAFAIPSPGLVSSLLQSILASLGILAAGVVMSVYALIRYWQLLRSKYSQARILIFIALAASIFLFVFISITLWRHHENQIVLQQELASIWAEHDANYDALDEFIHNEHLRTLPGILSWQEFTALPDPNKLILDIREPAAFALDHIDGSINMRFTDLLFGDWKELETYKNTPIYIVCFQGTTGALISQFLTSQGFTAVYRPKDGLIGHRKQNNLESVRLPIDQTRHLYLRTHRPGIESIPPHAFVIDLRLQTKAETTLPSSSHKFIYPHKTAAEIEAFIGSVPTDRPVILFCNSEVSCYSSDILALDLAAAGKSVTHIIPSDL